MNLLAISGSLRKDSFNTALLRAVAARAKEGVEVTLADLASLPLYNQDLEAAYPAQAQALKDKIRAADAVIIATPEFNRSIPGVLKNAIDWTSRPYGDNAWKGKPVYVMGASSGPIGTAPAQYDLKKIMLYLDAYVLGQPEFYLGNVVGKFDGAGVLTDESTIEHIDKALAAFTAFVERFRAA